ncbi:MAG: MFS transporter [Spirochaeta sp.]
MQKPHKPVREESFAHGVAPLSDEDRAEGIRCYMRHAVWNGLGINLLNVNIISILAITYGATNLQLGYISSTFHVAGIVLVLLPKLLHGVNIRTVFFTAWFLRGMICFCYASLFFISDQQAVTVIMLIYTAFAILRSAGIPMHHPLQRQLLRPAEEGRFISRLHFRLSISQLLSQVLSFLFLSMQFAAGTAALVCIPLFGAGCNTVAAYYIKRIPSNEHVAYRTGRTVFVLFRETMQHRERSRVVIAYWLGLSSMIVFAFGIAFLQREAGLPTHMVFLYTIGIAIAAIAASSFVRPFADRMGSRPLLILSYLFLIAGAGAWAFVSPDLPWILYYLLGFFCYFFLRLVLLLVSRLIVRALPARDRIAYTSMLHFFGAIMALGVGLLSGRLADWGQSLHFFGYSLPHQYSLTFVFGTLLSLAAMLTGYGMKDPGSMSLRQSAGILLSLRNLRAFLRGV